MVAIAYPKAAGAATNTARVSITMIIFELSDYACGRY